MFEIIAKDNRARAGVLHTAHGALPTPFFMPVVTKGTGKFFDTCELDDLGATTIISNALILSLRPGTDLIEKAGGYHKFISYDGAVFTDSGGFQMYSDQLFKKTDTNGVWFKDPYSGDVFLMTPEKNMQIHHAIGSDVAMCLDDMPMFGADRERLMASVQKTLAWAKRCKAQHDILNVEREKKGLSRQLLFGIAQGGTDKELREYCAKEISAIGFDGIAFGGLALGEPMDLMFDAIDAAIVHMPEEKPKYLMGVGVPQQILEAIGRGVDCFDSRYPSLSARHATVFSLDDDAKQSGGKLNITNARFAEDFAPIDSSCDCMVCKNYSRAYIRHLARLKEPSAMRYMTIHNLRFMQNMIAGARQAIIDGTFDAFKAKYGA